MKFKLLLPVILTFSLVACAGLAKTPTALPTIMLGNAVSTPVPTSFAGGSVTASGIVVADQEAHMAFNLAGNVKLVNVALGDQVQAGQILVQLDDTAQQIELEQANLALRELTSPEAIANAKLAITTAQTNVTNAQLALNNLQYWKNNALIQNYYANMCLPSPIWIRRRPPMIMHMPGNISTTPTRRQPIMPSIPPSIAYNNAQYYYSLYSQAPTQTQQDQAQANLDLANATLKNAQIYLAALTGGTVPADATGTALLQLKQDQLAVQTAQEDLDATRLVAPFSGEVASVTVSVGDYVSPGQVILVISDVNHMHVETTDLSERDVPKVKLGQVATVSIKALNQDVSGKVSAISPLADTLGGDVVYKVTILLDILPSNLLAGMSVDVQFNTGP